MSESEATAGLEESSTDNEKVKAINGMKEMEEVKLQNGESEKPQINGDVEKGDGEDSEGSDSEDNGKSEENRNHKEEEEEEEEEAAHTQQNDVDASEESMEADGVVTNEEEPVDEDNTEEKMDVSEQKEKEAAKSDSSESGEEKEKKVEEEKSEGEKDNKVKDKDSKEGEKDKKEVDKDSEEGEKDDKEAEKENKQGEKTNKTNKEGDKQKKESEKKGDAVTEEKPAEKPEPKKSEGKRSKKSARETSDDIQEVPIRETRQLRVRRTPKKYTEDDDDIKITDEVIKDDSSDIEMIEESDPLAISDADVRKIQQKEKKEIKSKDPNVIIIDTNTLLKNQGNLAAAVAQSTSTTIHTVTARGTSTAVSNINIQNAIQAITGGVPAQGLQSAYITALQQVSPKVLLAQGGQVPMNSQHLAQLQQYYNSLGHLQDDAYVIEAPSFIVPYVMEGKPKEPIKTFLRRINKDLEEFEKKEKEEEEKKKAEEKRLQEEKEKEEKEKKKKEEAEERKRKREAGEEVSESEDEEKKEEEEKEEKMETEKVKVIRQDKKDDKDSKVEKDEEKEDTEVDSKKDKEKKDDKKVKESEENNESKEEKGKETDKGGKKDDKGTVVDDDDKENKGKVGGTDSVVDVEKDNKKKKEEDMTHLGKWEPYYRSALGKFMLDLGLNQAQEFLQCDLLRMQKRKLDKMKTTPSREGILSVRMLEKQLEFTRIKNSHLSVPLKICKFCNFKTESELVMDRHLESPHMVNYTYKCNFCDFETRGPQVILFHMEAEHNIRGRLERAPAFFQCSLCPYEDNNKSKMTRHSFSCSKKYKPEKNCELIDWEPPAKIPKVLHIHRGRPNTLGKAFEPVKMPNLLPKSLAGMNISIQSAVASNLLTTANAASIAAGRGRGRPVGSYKNVGTIANQVRGTNTGNTGSLLYTTRGTTTTTTGNLVQQVSGNAQQFTLGNQMFHLVNGHLVPMSGAAGSVSSVSVSSQSAARVPRILPSSSSSSVSLIPGLGASSSITIQSVQSKVGNTKSPQQPSISITPLPRGGQQQTQTISKGATPTRDSSGKPSFVICEICDGYIKDLEQLRNHMNLIHKVKIHPKMIYNRPPLNCQKCQHRFFTDQGLERHLLGTHGLVTSSMQEAANKGKDAGRCPICGKVFQWKLLNHVSRDHKMTLKPAHLSYKCTVCTATFNMYRLFENHVYSAHSVVNKNKGDSGKKQGSGGSGSSDSPLKINDEITIIPQPAVKSQKSDKSISSGKKSDGTPTVSKEITITKVGSRPTRRSGSSVEVISLDESPTKKAGSDSKKRSNKDNVGNGSKKARTSS
ncbi:LOW QUALITY PROTEIN: MOG interacting and ectopic P-granules protein 1-like [Homarus americanus]|uniref:LOW QUALITY PROTEIN: MOG interacting and ectopic P-granules protein 1-like n=1 Tax=Homarus americanus TaxID=6706 RepID=UPI001C47AB80|nr:LOW QUALITY PROTEIN: MOG interacting and ectopic P-granules protein 1-like [Homarus americanus]